MKKQLQIIATGFTFFLLLNSASADIIISASDAFGGAGGNSFVMPKEILNDPSFRVGFIKNISIKVSNRIEKIKVTWTARNGEEMMQVAGEDGGTWKQINLSPGEVIIKVTGRAGQFVNQICFFTNFGAQYGPFGGNIGKPFKIIVPKGHRVIGFFGNSGQCIDKVGLVYRFDTDSIEKEDCEVDLPRRPTPRPAPRDTDVNPNIRDHRNKETGKSPVKKPQSNFRDHRNNDAQKQDQKTRNNLLDPDRAGG